MMRIVLAAAAAFILAVVGVGVGAPVFGQGATPTSTLTPRHFEFVKGALWWGAEPGDPRGRQYVTIGCRPTNPDLPWGSRNSRVTVFPRIMFPGPDGNFQGPGVTVWYEIRRHGGLPNGLPCDLRKGIDTMTFALPGPVAASQWEKARVVARFYPYPRRPEHEGLVLVGSQLWHDYPDSVPRSDAAVEADDFE